MKKIFIITYVLFIESIFAQNINFDNKRYSAPDQQVYYEYGFGLENIGLGNFKILRVDFNWRGNYLDRPEVKKFAVKFGIQVVF